MQISPRIRQPVHVPFRFCYVFENAQDGENQLAMKKPAFIYSRLANPTGMYWNTLISIPPLSTYEFGWITPFLIRLIGGSHLWSSRQRMRHLCTPTDIFL